jgi:hypothetical protein
MDKTESQSEFEEAMPPEEKFEMAMENREILVNPSDLQDVGDPEAGDVGVAGGLAAGGEMEEGEYGQARDMENDPWGLGLAPEEPLP